MTKVEIGKPLLLELCKHVGNFTDEVNLHFDKEKMWMRGVDPAHVVMVCLEVPGKAFSLYEVFPDGNKEGQPEEMVHSFDSGIMKFRLKNIEGNKIELEWLPPEKEKQPEQLSIAYDDGEYPVVLKVNSPDMTGHYEGKLPGFNTLCSFQVHPATMCRMLNIGCDLTDHVHIRFDEDIGMPVIWMPGESGSIQMALAKSCKMEVVEPQKRPPKLESGFPLDYFQNIFRACKDYASVTVEFGVDCPVRIFGEVGLAPRSIKYKYFLAPRIEVE